MARKIKFALEMKNGIKVRSGLDELRKNFDLDSIIGYFLSGKLMEWLDDRYYEEEADKLRNLERTSTDLNRQICSILCVPYEKESELSVDQLERLNEKRAILRQKTSDNSIISHAGQTALTQDDLADLLDMDEPVIYLCGETFNIPIRVEGKEYIGILGMPRVTIKAKTKKEIETKKITFKNVVLPWSEKEEEKKQKLEEKNSKTTKTRIKADTEKKTKTKPNDVIKKKAMDLLKWLGSEDARGWVYYDLWYIYPASINDSTERDIKNNIRAGAREFLDRLRGDLRVNLKDKLSQLEEAQKKYDKILSSRHMRDMTIEPSLQSIREKVHQTLESLCDLKAPSGKSLEEILIEIARYEKRENPGFSGIFGGKITVLASDEPLVRAAGFFARKSYENLSESVAGKAVRKYLNAMEINLKKIIDGM